MIHRLRFLYSDESCRPSDGRSGGLSGSGQLWRTLSVFAPPAASVRTRPGGYTPGMNTLDENLVRDTICGLELQLIDAVERQERAEVQHDPAEAGRVQTEVAGLQQQLAAVAEAVAQRY